MRLSHSILATAGVTAATTWLLRYERTGRRAAERFAAAALETLLYAIDANDPDTGAHVRRVATYALVLADAAGLSTSEHRAVERAALFHDIGKIHQALFDIIHDDDELTPSDRRAIATHPARGARVLAPLGAFYPELSAAVLAHHERWDGSGYPRGLAGRHIPLAARIVTIADTFDAVTHHRRYRGARSAQIARDIILEGRGSQFDPELVDLFVLPPVFEQILESKRAVSRWHLPIEPRRPGAVETHVPDINFRWRPGRRGAQRRHAAGPRIRTAR
jgi:putative two-component system response regulator